MLRHPMIYDYSVDLVITAPDKTKTYKTVTVQGGSVKVARIMAVVREKNRNTVGNIKAIKAQIIPYAKLEEEKLNG